MAKGKFWEWIDENSVDQYGNPVLIKEKAILLQGWARDGLTDDQIAHNMGISRNTLYVWENRFPCIRDALKNGKEIVDFAVENALLKKALDGDTTAMIFWLKNRQSQRWRDKPREEERKEEAVKVIIDV